MNINVFLGLSEVIRNPFLISVRCLMPDFMVYRNNYVNKKSVPLSLSEILHWMPFETGSWESFIYFLCISVI